MRRMTPRRGGFTLVELLAVIAILAVLAALATAAFLRARGGAEVQAAEAAVSKLRGQLDTSWKATMDDARDDLTKGRIPAEVFSFAGPDKDRVLAVWTYCKLKNAFPTTIAEACNPVFVPVEDAPAAGTFGKGALVLPPKSVFTTGFKAAGKFNVAGRPEATEELERTRPMRESAACLHWALTNTAVRGQSLGQDGLPPVGDQPDPATVGFTTDAAGTTPGSVTGFTLRAFKDPWGNPIGFLRTGYTAEVDDKPYVAAKAVGATTWNRDPLDPRGTLINFTGGWTQNHLNALFTFLYPLKADNKTNVSGIPLPESQHAVLPQPTPVSPAFDPAAGNYPSFRKLYFPVPASMYPQSGSPASPRNWVPTLVCAGADKQFADDVGRGDDILSFRLAREGNRGN